MNSQHTYIDKIKEGDIAAFRNFVFYYSKDLYYYTKCIVHTNELVEEIVSDVFLEVWTRKETIDSIQNIKAWLITLTHNKAISYIRKEESHRNTISWEGIEHFQLPGTIQSPDEQLISKEETLRINHLIQTLPPKCKQVFVLAKIEKLPYKEISTMLNISVKTINIHIAKALELISKGLKK